MPLLEDGLSPMTMNSFTPEVLMTSEESGQLWNFCLWNPNSGSGIRTFKGNSTLSQSATFLGDTYLISAQPNKPLLNIWFVHRHDQLPIKMTTPGPLNALAASPSGKFIIGAVEEKIYIWQTCNGLLLRILEIGHLQKITKLAFVDSGDFFVSSAKDGKILVWSLLDTINLNGVPGRKADEIGVIEPIFNFNHHSLSITDFYVSRGGSSCIIATASLDQTCKLYGLPSGNLLLDVFCGNRLHSVTMDPREKSVIVGSENGDIFVFDILSPPRNVNLVRKEGNYLKLSGHKDKVTCLSVTIDGELLASGCDDKTVKMWCLKSGECVRTIEHRGKITTTKFIPPLNGMLQSEHFVQNLSLAHIQKKIFDSSKEQVNLDYFSHKIYNTKQTKSLSQQSKFEHQINSDNQVNDPLMSDEAKQLQAINKKMYHFVIDKIMDL